MNQSFSKVAELWKHEKRQYVKISSYSIYVHLLNKHILPVFGHGGAPEEHSVQGFANRMLSENYSIKTVKDALLVIKMIVRYGEKLGVWPHVEYMVHFPSQAAEQRALPLLSAGDLKKLQHYLSGHLSFRNLGILICLESGLRIGEVCGLKWHDIDLAAGVFRVGRTVSRIYLSDGAEKQYFVSVGTPKTASSVREVPIARGLMTIIRPLRKQTNGNHYVVSNEEIPCEPRYLRAYYSRILTKLGIPPVRFHALRHSFATRCIENRCDYKTLSVLLGHASISTTMDLYVHPGFSEKKRVIDKYENTLLSR